jgi:hypothetical protein
MGTNTLTLRNGRAASPEVHPVPIRSPASGHRFKVIVGGGNKGDLVMECYVTAPDAKAAHRIFQKLINTGKLRGIESVV